MSISVASSSVAAHVAANVSPSLAAAPPAKVSGAKAVAPAPVTSASSSSSSTSQQQAALRQLLAKYTAALSHGSDPATLSALGRQIAAAAKALGQHVTLPHAPAVSSDETATANAAANSVAEKGKVNVLA